MSCALRVNTATQVKVNFHLLRRGAAKRGWCCVAPSPFAAWSAAPVILPVYLLSLRGLCGGRFPANVPPSPQRPSEAKAWPHPSALPPLALGKPASPRTVHWLAPYIARWFAQGRARRGNAYSVGCADLVYFCEAGRCASCLFVPTHPACQAARGRATLLFPSHLPRFPSAPRGSLKTVNRLVSVRRTETQPCGGLRDGEVMLTDKLPTISKYTSRRWVELLVGGA